METENKAIYDEGYQCGLMGVNTPDHNPYEDRDFRYIWGEGFFDGYKQYLETEKDDRYTESI